MIRGLVIREAVAADRDAISALVEAAFRQREEARLVERLREDGAVVLELLALNEGGTVGHIMFSRLRVEEKDSVSQAVALAPIAVKPDRQNTGIGSALVENAHKLLSARGEKLSVVLGDPAWYSRFGYEHARAARFESEWQCPELQALAWGHAPETGRLNYPPAFSGL